MQDRIQFIQDFQKRTKRHAISAVELYRKLPKSDEARIIGRQFLRSALSVGANYRAACRARSKAELFSKLSVTVEEADEALYWIEVLEELQLLTYDETKAFCQEGSEILAILSVARKNAR
ncbi:MAG: four helix bundle protein [Cyclobacteriaceae bacterium]|jgi:four helix bundle protein|nr:four helix bundle protein [Cyclobacteriaceae bacterium]